jgi:hypothetical protein
MLSLHMRSGIFEMVRNNGTSERRFKGLQWRSHRHGHELQGCELSSGCDSARYYLRAAESPTSCGLDSFLLRAAQQ